MAEASINRYRFPNAWDKSRTEHLVERIRGMGIDKAEEILDSSEYNSSPKSLIIAHMLKSKFLTIKQIAKALDMPEGLVMQGIDYLRSKGYRVKYYEEDKTYRIFTRPVVKPSSSLSSHEVEDELVLGICSDTHLGSKYAREDLLSDMYDIFEKEGVTEVLHAGNLLEGYNPRINGNDVIHTTLEGQTQYAIDAYPSKKNIKTYFISTDCHSGWWARSTGIDVGKYVELSAKEAGRYDLIHSGYLVADRVYRIKGAGKVFRARMWHPKGGSSPTNDTLALQRMANYINNLNEPPPDLLVSGHFHKMGYTKVKKIHCMHAGSFQQPTPFMHGNQLLSRLAGFIVRVQFNKKGDLLTFSNKIYDFDWAFDSEYADKRKVVWSAKGF